MAPKDGTQTAGTDPGATRRRNLYRQFRSLLHAAIASRFRRTLALHLAAIVCLIVLNTYGQIRLNAWQGGFYDSLEKRNVAAFLRELGHFVVLASALLVIVVSETWFAEMAKVRVREWITSELLDKWLTARRPFLLAFAGAVGVNPDQRMQEDARRFTELSVELGIGLMRAALLLVSFVGVLWALSSQVVFTWSGQRFSIPGYMVWCALAYALLGSALTWRIGRPLIDLNAERYTREANLRFELVRINDNAQPVSLYRGEAHERRHLERNVASLIDIMTQLARGITRLTWVTSGYGWLALVVPIIVAAPGYFGGGLSLGGLMMVAGAFFQVQDALRWFVDNFSKIADWRAILLRISDLRDELRSIERLERRGEIVSERENDGESLIFEDLSLSLSGNGDVAGFEEPRIEIRRGERVIVTGDPGAGKTTLLLAVAGLWRWGSGTLVHPPRTRMGFVPQRPYVPLGTLRECLAYPEAPDHFTTQQLADALGKAGLAALVDSLDIDKRWDKELPIEDQQRLSFARVFAAPPDWLFVDEAMSTLQENHRNEIFSVLRDGFGAMTIVYCCRYREDAGTFDREIVLHRHDGHAPHAPTAPVGVT